MTSLSVDQIKIEKQQEYEGSVFPHVLRCNDKRTDLNSATDWVRMHASDLLASATRDGAVLLRDFPVSSAEDFDAIVEALHLPNFP